MENGMIKKAKAMERNQIIETFKIGMDMWAGYTPEQYYNEIYEK